VTGPEPARNGPVGTHPEDDSATPSGDHTTEGWSVGNTSQDPGDFTLGAKDPGADLVPVPDGLDHPHDPWEGWDLVRADPGPPLPTPLPDKLPAAPVPIPPAVPDVIGDEGEDLEHDTDLANGRMMIEAAGRLVRWVEDWSSWVVWDGSSWVLDPDRIRMGDFARAVTSELRARAGEAIAEGNDQRGKALHSRATRAARKGGIDGMIWASRGRPGIRTDSAVFDQRPELLTVPNGTVDLARRQLRPHDPGDMLTVGCPTVWDPSATAPLWERCLEQWQPDPEVRAYLQVVAGSALVGHHVERLFVMVGSGANGKSAFWGAVQRVLGDYAVVPDPGLLVEQHNQVHSAAKLDLRGARLLVAAETTDGARLAESTIKELTGGDRISARRLYSSTYTHFLPSWTAVMHTNHRPMIRGVDEGIWRRVRLVDWPTTIPEGGRDPHLARRLAAEAPGILGWLTVGAQRFLASGARIDDPPSVSEATAAYRASEDQVGAFLEECCELGDDMWCTRSDLRAAYEEWSRATGYPRPLAPRILSARLQAKGVRAEPSGSRRKWLGVAVTG